jgi:hypothetical protein
MEATVAWEIPFILLVVEPYCSTEGGYRSVGRVNNDSEGDDSGINSNG